MPLGTLGRLRDPAQGIIAVDHRTGPGGADQGGQKQAGAAATLEEGLG